MRTEYLEYLLEVARTNSISAAAKNLFIGQTTLSAVINSVENELNVKIFIRTHRGVRLTERGEQVVALAESIVEKNRQLMDLNSAETTTRRNVPLVAYPSACSSVGLYLNTRIGKLNGTPSLSIYESQSSKVVSNVINGTANIGIGASGHHELFTHQCAAHNSGLFFEPLYTDQFCLCVGSRSHFAERESVDVSELRHEHLAATRDHSASSPISVGGIFKHVHRVSIFNNAEILKKVVQSEDMISVLPRLSFFDDPKVSSGELRLLKLTGFETELRNFLIVNQRSQISSYEKQAIQFIHDFYAQLDI